MSWTKDIQNIVGEMANGAVRNYATAGLSSFLVGGKGKGKGRVRLFTSDRDTREWITPHSHRFDFTCAVLDGEVENTLFEFTAYRTYESNSYVRGLVTPVAGGLGKYEIKHGNTPFDYIEITTVYKEGDTYSMTADMVHSIRFSKGARVLFFEGPETRTTSAFLEPYSDGKPVRTFKTHDWMFER